VLRKRYGSGMGHRWGGEVGLRARLAVLVPEEPMARKGIEWQMFGRDSRGGRRGV
jgi:hypothetical protein